MQEADIDADLLRDIALFVEVAKANSFGVAATRLGMPNSSLSVRISRFERALGLRLFHRSTRRISLTEEGAAYLLRCEPILEEALAATLELRERGRAAQGHLRLSMPVDFGTLMLAPIVAQFALRYPDISIDFDASPVRIDLVGEQCDLAIRMGAMPDSSLNARGLGALSRGLYASPEYLRRAGVVGHPCELAGHECIRLGASTTVTAWEFSRQDESVEVAAKGRFWANNYGMTRQLVLEGLGMARQVDRYCISDVSAGRLVRVLSDWTIPSMVLSAVMPSRMLPQKTRLFLDFLSEAMREETRAQP